MKRNGTVLLMSALMLLSAVVYISGCSQPASNSSQNQGQSGNQGNQTDIEGIWEVKKLGSITYPKEENGVEIRQFYYIKNGKIIRVWKRNQRLQRFKGWWSYTLSGNTITIQDSQPPKTMTYSISGSSLKMTGSDDFIIEYIKVTSPTAQEIESAPQEG